MEKMTKCMCYMSVIGGMGLLGYFLLKDNNCLKEKMKTMAVDALQTAQNKLESTKE